MIPRYAQFWFFEIGSDNSLFTTFCVWFFKKMFLMLYSINWPNLIVSLLLLLEILGNMCTVFVWLPVLDMIKFEINLIFLIKPFFYIIKKSRQKFKHLENKKSFQGEIKSIFLPFLKGFQLAKIVSDLVLHL